MLNGGKIDGKQILSPFMVENLMKPQFYLPGEERAFYGYGLLGFEDRRRENRFTRRSVARLRFDDFLRARTKNRRYCFGEHERSDFAEIPTEGYGNAFAI